MTAGGAAMACLHYYPGQEADPVVLTLANQSVSLNQSFSIYTPMDSMTVMLWHHSIKRSTVDWKMIAILIEFYKS